MVSSMFVMAFLMGASPIQSDSISFKRGIKPIFNNNCIKCHYKNSSLPNILEYKVAKELTSELREAMTSLKMPHKSNTLTASERDKVIMWIDQGAKE